MDRKYISVGAERLAAYHELRSARLAPYAPEIDAYFASMNTCYKR